MEKKYLITGVAGFIGFNLCLNLLKSGHKVVGIDSITNAYDENFKLMKPHIRNKLKENHKEDYNSGLIENILLDIFQDRESNIFKIIEEIKIIQKKNYKLQS